MSQQVDKVQSETQATPLSQDVLRLIQGQISGDSFSAPTALGRQTGQAAQRFLEQGPPTLPADFSQALQQSQQRQQETALADLREQFGQQGARFGTSIGRGTSDLLTQLSNQQTQQRFDIRRQLGEQELRGIQAASRHASRTMQPFLDLAGQGIVPEQVVTRPNPWVSGAQAIGGLARGAGAIVGAV